MFLQGRHALNHIIPLRGGSLACFLIAISVPFLPLRAEPAQAADIKPMRLVARNGLTVLVLEQHALPILQLHALVKVGSAQDPPNKAGLANLTASLLDEGTTKRTSEQIAEQIDFVGGRLHTDVSADFTTASARVLTKDMDLGFELLSEILRHPSFPKREVRRVQNHILGEIQSEEDEPGLVAAKAFDQLVFGQHPYRWPVNGTTESLANIARKDILSFFSREYLPNQTILAIVGDITLQQAKARVARYFGDWKRRTVSPRKYQKPTPIRKPGLRLIDKALTQSTIMLGHLGIRRADPDYYAVTVMNYILGSGGFSSRLMDSIRDKQGLAYGVYSSFKANQMPGAFTVSLQTRSEATNKAIEGVLTEIRAIRDQEVSDQELNDAKAYLMGSFPLRLDTTSKLAQVLSLVEFYGLGLEYFTDYPQWIEQVTKQDVLRAANTYLDPKRYVLVVVGDQAKAKVKQQ